MAAMVVIIIMMAFLLLTMTMLTPSMAPTMMTYMAGAA
jgi:hypothetical protein